MELVSTLLATLSSLFLGVSIALYTFVGGVVSPNPTVVILTPAKVAEKSAATTSSQTIIGTATPKKTLAASSTLSTSKPASKVVTQQPATTLPAVTITADALNEQTRGAVVNILCATQGSSVRPISGSGVFVDSRGIILTNAHVGQYFLLKDYPKQNSVDCIVRTGNPAQPKYYATLLYLPPTWISKNASQLVAEQAKGTGEDDYAFLLVTGSTGPAPLPQSFPALPMTIAEPNTDDAAFLAAYPAGFLDGINIEKNLYQTSAYATVKELYTYGDGRDVDLVSVGGTIVSQGGSSGGATVRASDGKLEGIISTATSADTTAGRDLRAVTLAHIERSLVKNGQRGIAELLSPLPSDTAAAFNATIAPAERETLSKVIERR
jgi:hypothetical protein